MRALFAKLHFGLNRRRKKTAYREVVDAFHQDPIAAYGLYHLISDTGLLSASAKRQLKPYVTNVETRLTLSEDDLQIKLPMKYEPITDVEHDTLTFVIGEAIREFDKDIQSANETLLLAELRGINSILGKHSSHTASISHELDINILVRNLLLRCGTRKKYQRPDGTSNIEPGDYFIISRLRKADSFFTGVFREERNLDIGDVVEIKTDWGSGYATATRLAGQSNFTRAWTIHQVRRAIPPKGDLVIVHAKEGIFYVPKPRFKVSVDQFVKLICHHDADMSLDPTLYSPDYDSAV